MSSFCKHLSSRFRGRDAAASFPADSKTAIPRLIKKVLGLMVRNAGRFMMVEWFSKCVVILSRVIIVFGAALACWVTVQGDERFGPGGELELTTPWTPTLVTGIAAWFVAYGLTDIYDEALTAVFMIFLIDEETIKLAKGSGTAYTPVVGKGLRNYVSTEVLHRSESSAEAYENPMTAKPGGSDGGGAGGGGGGDDTRPNSIELNQM